jgi:hypothetical protein
MHITEGVQGVEDGWEKLEYYHYMHDQLQKLKHNQSSLIPED